MSLERCLELISQKYDVENDPEALVEELADLSLQEESTERNEDYLGPLNAFLERIDELFSEEDYDEGVLRHSVANLRSQLEAVQDKRTPEDPLEHLFLEMTRYEAGRVQASKVLTTLSHYESLMLALRHQFEECTDPLSSAEIVEMMRRGLGTIETAGKRLREELNNDSDMFFDEIREQFDQGVEILREFRRNAVFVDRN